MMVRLLFGRGRGRGILGDETEDLLYIFDGNPDMMNIYR